MLTQVNGGMESLLPWGVTIIHTDILLGVKPLHKMQFVFQNGNLRQCKFSL